MLVAVDNTPPTFSSQNNEVVTVMGKCVTQCCLSTDTTIQTNMVCVPAWHYPIYNLNHSTIQGLTNELPKQYNAETVLSNKTCHMKNSRLDVLQGYGTAGT